MVISERDTNRFDRLCQKRAERHYVKGKSGTPNWDRTSDNLIKSQVLYQLSYDFVIIPTIEIQQFP